MQHDVRVGVLAGILALLGGLVSPVVSSADTPSANGSQAEATRAVRGCGAAGGGYVVCTTDGDGPSDRGIIYSKIENLVKTAPSDASIRFAIFNWSAYDGPDGPDTPDEDRVHFMSLANALTAKVEDGADVRVILGNGCKSSGSRRGSCSGSGSRAAPPTPQERVQRELEKGDVDVRVCKKSCLPRNGSTAPSKIMHNKFLLIGDGSEGKVAQFTSNFMWNQLNMYQDLVVIPDDEVYRFYGDYFERLWTKKWMGWSNDDARTLKPQGAPTAAGRAFAFPRNKDNPVNEILESVDCQEDATVRVAHGQLKREDVLNTLDALEDDGCEVRIMADGATEKLIDDGPWNFEAARFGDTHSKFILIDAHFNGGRREQRLYTGSHNPREQSLCGSSDAMVRVDPVFDTYSDYFESQWDTISSRTTSLPRGGPARAPQDTDPCVEDESG